MKLLNSGNSKTVKGEESGFRTFGIHLAPATLSGHNVCFWASRGCKMACLNTAGRGAMSSVQTARINKTKFFFKDRFGFMEQLIKEISSAIKSATKAGLTPCFRLNLTSDIPWEAITHEGKNIFQHFPHWQFYDYSKGFSRVAKLSNSKLAPNYNLTYSRSEETKDEEIKALTDQGINVAVVFRGELPKSYLGIPVVDGDKNDLRFLDPRGVIVGLIEKGLAKKDETNFVVDPR